MNRKIIDIDSVRIGAGLPLVLIAGPCVIESEESTLKHAFRIKEIAEKTGIPFIFKSSYDKANRTSIDSFRGPGIKAGLEILYKVKQKVGVPVVSDVHKEEEISLAEEVLDILQIPAFLCRQTDLVIRAAESGKALNIKKGQFMSPAEMGNVISKVESVGNKNILLTERGTTFGYNMLVNDFRAIPILAETGYPVVYDATHSVQMPGGKGSTSGGESRYVLPLSKAAVAIGCNALFLEVHEDPETALSDGPNMVKLSELEYFLKEIKKIEKAVR